jgi:hypothetical protein
MQYYKNNDWYEVVRITGPTHNLLGLWIDDEPVRVLPIVEAMSTSDAASPEFEALLQTEVLEGVRDANSEFATDFQIRGIRYVGSDTLELSIFRELARHLIEHVAKQGDFVMRG